MSKEYEGIFDTSSIRKANVYQIKKAKIMLLPDIRSSGKMEASINS